MSDRSKELLNKVQAAIECPPATQDITINLANRIKSHNDLDMNLRRNVSKS